MIANPVLDFIFIAVTVLGEQLIAVAALTIVYWLIDKESGEYMCFSLLASLNINGLVKNICKFPRPIGQPGIRSLRVETATGYSFPSGHTQTSATLFTSLAWILRRRWVTVAALAATALVAFSRMYLGVHWPKDVLAGFVLGGAVSLAIYAFFSAVGEQKREWLYLGMAVAFAPLVWFWHDTDFVKAYGMLLGFAIAMPLEHRYVKFTMKRVGRLRSKLLREAVGLAVLGVVKVGLSLVMPDLLPFQLVEYMLVSLSAFLLCPYLFVRLHI